MQKEIPPRGDEDILCSVNGHPMKGTICGAVLVGVRCCSLDWGECEHQATEDKK